MGERTDPYIRIMEAAKAGRGVHLSADEVWKMSLDCAIATRATYLTHPYDTEPATPENEGE